MVKCQCPMCKECFEAENEWLGQEAQCPYCEQIILIQQILIKPQKLSHESIEKSTYKRREMFEPMKQKSLSSLILGWIGLLAWLIPLIGFPVTIIGLILGCRKKYSLGIWLNIVGLVLTIVNSIWGAILGAQGELFFQ